MDIDVVEIRKNSTTTVILGHAGFIKTVEDLYEALVSTVPGIKFGIAFAEASGPKLIRSDGNDEELKKAAEQNMARIACGHAFIILVENAYAINVANAIKGVSEVVTLHCATANPVQVLVANSDQGRGVIGVIDGGSSGGVESDGEKEKRHKFLRDIGYKR